MRRSPVTFVVHDTRHSKNISARTNRRFWRCKNDPFFLPPGAEAFKRDIPAAVGRLLLKRVGTRRYAADPGTEVLCGAFAIDNEPVQLWIPGDPVPSDIYRSGGRSKLDRVLAQ
jgi:hypothetical protein